MAKDSLKKVHVNFKGAFAADGIESDKPNLVDPIWAYPIERAEVRSVDIPCTGLQSGLPKPAVAAASSKL